MSAHEEVKLSPRAKAASVALNELQKAIRYFRLYPHQHPFCVKSVQEAQVALVQFIERNGPLEAEIEREGILVDEQLALKDSEQTSDLGSLLFPEGIRTLSFEAGLTDEEVFGFIEILAANYQDDLKEVSFGNDLVTALWRRDFAHIVYKIHDVLSPASVRSQKEGTIAAVAQRIQSLVEEISSPEPDKPEEVPEAPEDAAVTADAAESVPPIDVKAFLDEIDRRRETGRLDDVANWSRIPEKAQQFLSTAMGRERAALVAELKDPFAGDLLGRTADIVVWAALVEETTPAHDDVARFLAGSTLNALTHGDVERAADMLARAQTADDGSKKVAPAVTARLGTADSLKLFADALEKQTAAAVGEAVTSSGARYLARLDPGIVATACDLYPSIANETVRGIFTRYLASRVGDSADEIAKLTLSKEPKVVEEGVALLAAASRANKESRAFKILEEASVDTKNPLRANASRAVVESLSGEKERKDQLHVALRDPDKSKRVAALKKLSDHASPKTFDDLVPLAQGPDFGAKDEDEIEAVLSAIAKIGKLRAVRVLQELSERRTLLFKRKETLRVSTIARHHLEALKKR